MRNVVGAEMATELQNKPMTVERKQRSAFDKDEKKESQNTILKTLTQSESVSTGLSALL